MDGGVSTINTHSEKNNTLLRSCLYTESHPHTQLRHGTGKLSCKATSVQKPWATVLDCSHQNDPSCEIPFLSSHTFRHLSPSFLCMHGSSIAVRPATILSCSRSHRSLASAQSLEQGAQFGRQGLRHVWQCFSRPLYREWLKRSQGCNCCSVSVKVYVSTGRQVTQITPEIRSTNNKMENVDKEQTHRQTQCNHVWSLSRRISVLKSE